MKLPLKLSLEEIQRSLLDLPQWKLKISPEIAIHREWKGRNFQQTFSVMTQIAMIAERLNHHPDWSNSYAQLQIALRTHDVDGLSALDFEMARRIEAVLQGESVKVGHSQNAE